MSFLDENFSDEYDNNPRLRGKQKDLPDALQKAIIGKTNEGVAKDLEMKAMEASSLEDFLNDVYQDYPQHKGNFDIKDFLTKYYLNDGGSIDEGKAKSWLVGLGLTAAAIAGLKGLDNSDPVVKAIKTAQIQGLVDTPAEKKAAKKKPAKKKPVKKKKK